MKHNLTLLLITLLLLYAVGELSVQALQHYDVLPDYRKGNISFQPNKIKPPKYIHSKNPILYIEHDITSPGINRWGTRDPDFALEKSPDVFRIAVVGDSVSFGFGVNYEDSFPYVLQSILNTELNRFPPWKRIEIVNFSVSGYGLEAYLEMYRTKVRLFHPDMVILGYVQNDPAPTSAIDTAVKDMMIEKKHRLQLAQYSQFAAWVYVNIGKLRGDWASKQEWAYYNRDDVLAKSVAQFRQFHHMLTENHTKGMVVIFPYFLDFSHYPLTKVHQVLTKNLEEDHLPVCDLLTAFSMVPTTPLQLQGTDIVHMSAEGNHFAAKVIHQCILPLISTTTSTP